MIKINEQYTQPLESLHYKNNKLHSATESSTLNCNVKVDSLLLQKASIRLSSSLTE